ncbi:MAG TPA: LysR substrate-binding domain-containing protein [Pseudolabrys sp.]|nr:LysR substrate-binding domain-containing protein [Pseudolabrys sp.]
MRPANVPDLTARQLNAVLAVAEYNSFIAAAAFLKTSQPALTRTIMRIEDVLGVRLFDRSTRRVAITAAGKEFVAVAERMLNDLRISVRSMREVGEEQRGQIIISSIMSVANGLIPLVAAKYRASRPGIEIILREGVHGAVLEDIRSGTADLGATYVDDLPDFVEAKRVSREIFDVILPRSHALTKKAGRSFVTLNELANFPMVSLPYESRTRRIIDGAAATAGLTLHHVATVTQFVTMMSFVRAGVGIAIAPSGAIAGFLGRDLAVLSLTKPRLSRDVGLIRLRERELTPAARGFSTILERMWRGRRQLMPKKK